MSKQKSNLNLLITAFGAWAFDGKTYSTPVFNADALPVSGGGPWKKSLIAALGEPAYEAFKKDFRTRLRSSLEANIVLEGLTIQKKEDNFFVENGPLFTHLNEIAVSQSVEEVPEMSETQHNLLVSLVPALAEAVGCPKDSKWGEQISHLKGLVTPQEEAATEESAEEPPAAEEAADAAAEQPIAETEAPVTEEPVAEEVEEAVEEAVKTAVETPEGGAVVSLEGFEKFIAARIAQSDAIAKADDEVSKLLAKLNEVVGAALDVAGATKNAARLDAEQWRAFKAMAPKATLSATTEQ
jgi:hypothetical protein